MSIESSRISVWDSTHLCVGKLDQGLYSNWTLAPFDSIIRGLSLLPARKGKRRRPALLQTLERSRITCQPVQKLRNNHYQTASLSDNARLKVIKLNSDSGTYLVVYESWNTVTYLQVSNAEGYVAVLGGLLFAPTIEQDDEDDRYYISRCAHNSLWTNGTDILNNNGDTFMKRNEDLMADIHCIKLESTCESMEEVAQPSSWRTVIGSSLQEATISENQYQQQQLRAIRRKYLFSESLAVLNQVVADEGCVQEPKEYE